ncbi:MAG: LptA/OstA family protein [Pseudomonadota bacterium]
MKKTIIITLALAITGPAAAPASAQLVSESDAPIDITGDTAEFQDNLAVWTGNVRVLQGEGILTTDRLEADLSEEGDFDNIRAIGSVRYSNGKEAITGDRALFDNIARTITITENVIVTQGKQVMSAGAVTYWVDTGKVKFLPEPGKRIRGIFYTGSDEEQT